jgi:quinol monooxygenase YgiN
MTAGNRIDRGGVEARTEGDVEQDVFVRLHAREGEERGVEAALREVAGASREESGCLSFHTFRAVRDRRLFYIHSRWVDAGAFERHAELAHTVRFLERVDVLLDEPRNVTRTEMME